MPSPNPMTRREHQGSAAPATLTATMSVSDLSFSISTNTGWPTGGVGPFFVVIDPGTGSEEKVLCSAQSTSICSVAGGGRGVDGTVAKSHAIGAVCYPVWTAQEADEANAHLAATSAVHGVVGVVVGTTDAQTLTNKTISGATNTLSAIPESAVTNLVTDLATLTSNVAGKQASDATLTALAAFNTNGILVQTAADTFAGRTITSSGATVTVTNPGGVAGNINLEVNESSLTFLPGATLHAFTADGTLAAASVTGAKKLIMFTWGGGGAGGGCPAPGTAPNATSGGGGGAGGFAQRILAVSGLTFPLQVNVGSAATGVSNAAGNNGATASVIDNNGSGSVLCRATGGTGGNVGAAGGTSSAFTAASAAGGGGNVGDVQLTGGNGQPGFRLSDFGFGGSGGASPGGGAGGTTSSGTNPGTGGAAPGGGGGGALSRNNGAAQAGGPGGAAFVLILAIY